MPESPALEMNYYLPHTPKDRCYSRSTRCNDCCRSELLVQQDALFAESERETEKILNEWTAANDKLYKQVKKLVDEYIKDSKYDGIILERDEGSFGRQVRTIIALEPNQVKNVSNAKPTKSNDIRYALADMTEEQSSIVPSVFMYPAIFGFVVVPNFFFATLYISALIFPNDSYFFANP